MNELTHLYQAVGLALLGNCDMEKEEFHQAISRIIIERDDLSQQLTTASETQTALESKNADLRQCNEDAESLLLIARAELETARETVTTQDAEIKRLRTALESIINRNVMHENHGAYLSPDNNEEEFQDIKRIALKALGRE